MNYNSFTSGSNYVSPSPSWSYSSHAPTVSTTIPLSEEETGALEFTKWAEFGEEFLVKSNINNWVTCSSNGGSLSKLEHGSVKCKIAKIIVPGVCEDVVPHILIVPPTWHGPTLFAREFYYFFDVGPASYWPVADPCGSRATNHLPNIPNPSGWVYLRESAAASDIEVIHVKNSSNEAGNYFCVSD